MDTRAMSKVKMGYEALDASSSHQDGKHLLGSIPGDDHDELSTWRSKPCGWTS